jgi:nitrate reductase (NAD(P)H)
MGSVIGVAQKVENSTQEVAGIRDVKVESVTMYDMEEVKLHNTSTSAWIIIEDRIYDITNYHSHPGGSSLLISNAGRDATTVFFGIHSSDLLEFLQKFHIGNLKSVSKSLVNTRKLSSYNIPHRSQAYVISQIIRESPDSYRIQMMTPNGEVGLLLPTGMHVKVKFKIGLEEVSKPYTPITSEQTRGLFEFLIKIYTKLSDKMTVSECIENMKVGDTVDVVGPFGNIQYRSVGVLKTMHNIFEVKRFSMLCGGTGITPIYQVLCAVLRDPEDTTELHVLYSNRREEDVLLRPELDALAVAHPNRLFLHYTLSNPPESFAHRKGRVDAAMIRECLPLGAKDTFALLCGPPGMLDVCTEALTSLGYEKENCVYF